MILPYLVITLCCISLAFRRELTALGRIIVIFCWLVITALWITTAARAQPTPIPTPPQMPTPHSTFPVIQCRPSDTDPTVTCCLRWINGHYVSPIGWLPGVWFPINCTK